MQNTEMTVWVVEIRGEQDYEATFETRVFGTQERAETFAREAGRVDFFRDYQVFERSVE